MTGPTGDRRVSVCMAAYNGATHVEAQVRSILDQLGPADELVIVDDASVDETIAVLDAIGDARIQIERNPANLGHVASFEKALNLAKGDFVLLADQDDLWPAERLDHMTSALQDTHFIAGSQDTEVLGHGVRSPQLDPTMSDHVWRDLYGLFLGKRAYFGCAMGMRREFLDIALPFPATVEAHDHWLSIAANVAGPFEHSAETFVLRRLHDTNLTPRHRRSLSRVLRTRWLMLRQVGEAVRRVRRSRRR